jgi:hypothetical protein
MVVVVKVTIKRRVDVKWIQIKVQTRVGDDAI